MIRINLLRKHRRVIITDWYEIIVTLLVMVFILLFTIFAFIELILHGRISN